MTDAYESTGRAGSCTAGTTLATREAGLTDLAVALDAQCPLETDVAERTILRVEDAARSDDLVGATHLRTLHPAVRDNSWSTAVPALLSWTTVSSAVSWWALPLRCIAP